MAHTIDVTTPTDREIRVIRVFDAPRALVFECHTTPELVRRWLLGPPGWTMPVCEIDATVGGRYRYVWRSDADGSEFGFRGQFEVVDRPDRIVHTERVDGDGAEDGGDALCTLVLTEDRGRTTLTYTMRFPTPEIRDQALQTGMTDGMGASYDRLDHVMAGQPVA